MRQEQSFTVNEIAARLGLTPVCCPEPVRRVTGIYIGDLLSWVMGRAKAGDAWLTIMSNQNVAAVAVLAEVSCVILAENVRPSEELRLAAEEHGVNLLCTGWSLYELTWRLHTLITDAAGAEAEEQK